MKPVPASDADLLRRGRTDARAFRQFYDRYAPRIHRFQLGRTGDSETALDLTAETFAQAWLSSERFRDERGGSAAPWLFAIARNVLVASVRKGQLERSASKRLGLAPASESVEPSALWLEGLDKALATLPTNVRRAIELRVIDDLPYSEVAAKTGVTPGAARVRVHRGLAALRQLLEAKEATR